MADRNSWSIRTDFRCLLALVLMLTSGSCGGAASPALPPDVGEELRVGLRITLITSGGRDPQRFSGLTDWSETAVSGWVDRQINPVFSEAQIRIVPGEVRLARLESTAYSRLETAEEITAFESFISDRVDPTVLNLFVVDICAVDSLVGEATDAGCNPDNRGRASWVMPLTSLAGQRKLVAHELGHIFNLPHISTGYPLTESNENLMSYGTFTLDLSTAIDREVPDAENPCYWYQPTSMNQLQVMRDWVRQYLPEIVDESIHG